MSELLKKLGLLCESVLGVLDASNEWRNGELSNGLRDRIRRQFSECAVSMGESEPRTQPYMGDVLVEPSDAEQDEQVELAALTGEAEQP